MARYTFYCNNCKQAEEKEMRIAEYMDLKEKQFCTLCNTKMVRILDDFACGDIPGYGIDNKKGVSNWQR